MNNDNLQITRTENSRDNKGTSIYFTFSFPVSGTQLDGNVVLDNQAFIAALSTGNNDDVYSGLYKAVMQAVYKDVTPYLSNNSSTTTTTTTTKEA